MQNPSPLATWLPIPGWEGWYEASDTGLIRSVTRTLTLSDGRVRTFYGQVLTPGTVGEYGHLGVNLHRQTDHRTCSVHRLVMLTFVGPCPDGMVVCHNDGDAANNRLSNLRYDTPRENTFDNVRNGTHHYAKRDGCKWGHPFNELNTKPGVGESRNCRACWMAGKVVKNKRAGGKEDLFQAVSDAFYMRIMAGGEIEHLTTAQRDQYVAVMTWAGKPPKRTLTRAEVAAIFKLVTAGEYCKDVAAKFGISDATASKIKRGEHPHQLAAMNASASRKTSA